MDWKDRMDAYIELKKEFATVAPPARHEFRFFDDPVRVDLYSFDDQCVVASVHSVSELQEWIGYEKRLNTLLEQRVRSWDFLA